MLAQLLFVLLLAVQVFSASNVAILYSTPSPTYEQDVEKKLAPYFTVTGINVQSSTPTLAQLQPYDAVLVYSDSAFFNKDALGDVLANYADLGKGVVVATFAFSSTINIGGRFNSGGYFLLTLASQTQGTQQSLVVVDPTSPILAGVRSFNGGSSSYRIANAFTANAHRVATWSDGLPLIATGMIGRSYRVDVNFYPPSSDARSDFWTSSTDGALILANALKYASGGASCSSYLNCTTCAMAGCQWCLDYSVCQTAPNFTCSDRVAVPGDCPALACPTFTRCSTCLASDVVSRCSWCLDNHTCTVKDAPCNGEINDPRFCTSQQQPEQYPQQERVLIEGAVGSKQKDKRDEE